MLRLFRDTVHIGLYADRILLVRTAGLAGRRTAHTTVALSGDAGDSPGATALDALQQVLQEPGWQGADARVLVSNALVYYATVPANANLMGAADELALAQLKFRQMHGAAGGACEVRLGNLLSGQDQIAAALDSSLVARLRVLLGAAQLQLRSLEPLLMHAYNRVRGQLASADYWFALAEPGLLLLAHRQQGQWASLSVSTWDGALDQALALQLQEARLMGGDASEHPRVYLATHAVDASHCLPSPELPLVKLGAGRTADPLADAQGRGLAQEALV